MCKRGSCSSCFGFIEKALRKTFVKLSHMLTSHPLPFLVLPIIVTLGLLPGFLRFNYVHDIEYLYTPINGQAKTDRHIFEEHFINNDTYYFSAQRKIDEEGFLRVILTDTSAARNIYSERGLGIVRDVNFFIKNFTTIEENLRYGDLCATWHEDCYENAIVRLSEGQSYEDLVISYPIHGEDGEEFLGNELGDVKVDSNGIVQSAGAVLLTYHVRYLEDSDDKRSSIWMNEVKDELLKLKLQHTKLSVATTDSLNDELGSISEHVIPLFSAAYVILCSFAMITCTMLDWIRSKTMVALAGYVSTALAIVSGMAFLVACGVPFASICSTMPFLLMGIGIDNMFVMVGIWRETSIRSSVKERMEETLSKAAVSITLTSITDCLAFGIGCISPFRSVRFFCAYACAACFFCYLYSITFLAGCLVYSGKMEEQNRHTATGRKIDPAVAAEKKRSKGNWLFKIFCWGSAVYHDQNETEDNSIEEQKEKQKIDSIPDILVPIATKLIEYPYSWLLLKAPIKALVFVAYFAYIGVAVWGCLGLEEGLELQNLAPDDSYLADFYPQYDTYFGSQFSGRIMVAITESLDYTDPSDIAKIDSLVSSFRNDKHFRPEDDMLEFWFYDLQEHFLEQGRRPPHNMPTLIAELRGFLSIDGYERYELDIEFNEMGTEILATRFLIQAGGVDGATDERDMVIRSRELTDQSQLDSVAYFRAYVFWEQYIIIMTTTLINLGIAIGSVLFVAMLLVPSLSALLMVALSICSITVGVIGFMSLWDVNLDSVSMINLVMCIGFSVDFSAHICYHFSIAENEGDVKKLQHKSNTKSTTNGHVPSLTANVQNNVTSNGVTVVSYKKTYDNGIENGGFDHVDENGIINPTNGAVQSGHSHSNGTNDILHSHKDFDKSGACKQSHDDNSTALGGNDKATLALSQLGLPILQGAVTTILAVAILSGSPDYIHRTFFKMIFLVMCFGFYHAMVVLPVVLAVLNDCYSWICKR